MVQEAGDFLGNGSGSDGSERLERRLRELKGTPVVVNVWADYCEPCRAELPIFQRVATQQYGSVAFLGVLSRPGSITKARGLGFLPYPSIIDQDGTALNSIGGNVGLIPLTAFYNAAGRRVLVHMGPYESTTALAADIRRYATAT